MPNPINLAFGTPTPITLGVGQRSVGPATLAAGYSRAQVTIDRTVAAGLNSLTPTSTLQAEIQESDDGGATWTTNVIAQTQGGITTNHNGEIDTFPILVSLSGVACQLRALLTIAGTAIAVAGSLSIT